MATDSNNATNCPGPHKTSGKQPPPATGDFRPTASSPVAIVRTDSPEMSVPSGRYVLPSRYIHQYRNVTVGSASTPPEYYIARSSPRRSPMNRVARAASAALESNRDHQPLLVIDAYTVPLQDGTVSPKRYWMIGLLFPGMCVAAALVFVYGTGGQRTTSGDLRFKEQHLSYDPPILDDDKAFVTFAHPGRRDNAQESGHARP
ncbi:hypothetical protein HPB50_007816 [Hyalomma asiaticum]|uniref:Uncharacterized protein n=1 Tax=Hyalomma asiaticum TaxID=266040 RepID=A0ACB7SB58_HYAAI|nr:hypothetical protein HPB50_007816 [Hyalomma asiaticum]